MKLLCPCCYEESRQCPEVKKILSYNTESYFYQRDALSVLEAVSQQFDKKLEVQLEQSN
jgi:hypothetical protein